MIRIIGILTGSALAVSFLIVVLGIPELKAPQPEPAEAPRPVAPTYAAPLPQPPPEPPPASEPAPHAESEAAIAEVPPEPSNVQPETVAVTEDVSTPTDQQWFAFWSPFRSKLAADGFVSQLQKTTGLDYRVVKLKPGVYEVAFAYSDDSDIQEKLLQISSATGLDLSGG
ncbi:MAG: hypothetical protein KJO01_02820 [Gammaproteobacteria bacterium]|nr:hypothetical protein [Gammaproteobacteria bacterium]